ncbi:hypothetical protein [Deinococcus hopiensis]|uniref:GIY-YIG domain-containing protein n=1 Tax=Deinococcus hopiensis KR-140 TaxID=695939 RepID=A0A1W1UWI7_9DEIO|nr:hypothetical protein [Deinococcus hopiensis]SMB85151.1 hypothetical protein SAMN00790413_03286 [Deinococcus hopiensis KR-140]
MNATEQTQAIRHFYTLLDDLEQRLGGRRLLKDCTSKGWPHRGVYFFFEPGEQRTVTGEGARVVRIGTHAVSANSKTSLWNRLSQHKGKVRDGGGNHRGSIFRSHVGSALLARDGLTLATWGIGSSAGQTVKQAEHEHEQRVSQTLGQFGVLWLSVGDAPGKDSERAFVEQNAIALLNNVNAGTDPGSETWLGRQAQAPAIRRSALWNVRHVDDRVDPEFLSVFERLVRGHDAV